MTIGPVFMSALAAAILATLAWVACNWKPTLRRTLGMFFFGVLLAFVILYGPLVRLP